MCANVCVTPLHKPAGKVTTHALPPSHAGAGKARPMSAPRAGSMGGGGAPGERPAGGAPTTPVELGNKRVVQAGNSWGTYNPIHHTWSAPPKDTRFHEPSQQLEKKVGDGCRNGAGSVWA